MRVLRALVFLLSTTVVLGTNAADDVVGQLTGNGVCTSSAAENVGDGDSSCSELLTEPTNDATVSPINDDDYNNDEEYEDIDDEDEEVMQFECIDEDEKCPTYAEAGACTDNPGYMTYHCAVSCNTCQDVLDSQQVSQFVTEGTNSKPCMDDHYSCLDWAGMGECDNNPV